MWYECKIKYARAGDDDKIKTFHQSYLFDALTFTEAEARANEKMAEYISTEFKITNIKLANFSEILPSEQADSTAWFKCKLHFLYLDEQKGTEKKQTEYILAQANNVKDAYEKLHAYFSENAQDFEITAVAESPILDVFPYQQE